MSRAAASLLLRPSNFPLTFIWWEHLHLPHLWWTQLTPAMCSSSHRFVMLVPRGCPFCFAVLVPRARLFGLSSSWRAQLHLPHLPMSATCLPFLVSHRLDERATPATLRPLIVDHSLPTAGVAPPPCHSISHLQLVSLLLSSLCISHRHFSLRVHHRSPFGSYFT